MFLAFFSEPAFWQNPSSCAANERKPVCSSECFRLQFTAEKSFPAQRSNSKYVKDAWSTLNISLPKTIIFNIKCECQYKFT
jgi:hypothetical protein